MKLSRSLTVAAATLALLAPVTVTQSTAVAAGPGVAQAEKPRKVWSPRTGVKFNEPRDPASSHRINRHVRKAINGTPAGAKIRLVSWNFNAWTYVGDLSRAHRRGVSVRVIMANGLAEGQSSSGPYATLKRNLREDNASRKRGQRSWFRTCRNSCRGTTGIQHAKYFMFSRVGKVDKVVMSTSANLTDAAASVQWNDVYTVVGQRKTWREFNDVFRQMSRDQQVKPAYHTFRDGQLRGWFFPRMGGRHNVMRMLDDVRCKGARGDAGINGRTSLRVAQSVFNGQVGTRIATKISALKRQGCNIKVIHGVLNNNSREALSNVPTRQFLQDTDGDGVKDRYLHMKAFTISGHYRGDRRAHVVYQGSANWSGMSVQSDEQGFIVDGERLELRYSRWINRLFRNPPIDAAPRYARGQAPKNPYSEEMLIEMGLVGKNFG